MDTCDVGRGEVWFDVVGPHDGPPVLLVCGGGGAMWNWGRLVPDLAEPGAERLQPLAHPLGHCRIAAFDQAGVGRSVDVPPARTAAQYAADALAVGRRALGEPFHLVGLSLGGAAAVQLALQKPDAVASLVLAVTFPGMSVFRPHDLVDATGDLPPPPAGATAELLAEAADAAPSFSPSFPAEHPDLFWEVVRRLAATPTAPDLDDVQVEQFVSHDVAHRLGGISAPTQVIGAALDRTMPVENSRLLAGAISGAELTVVEASGHAVHVEAPEVLAAAIRAATAT